MAEKTASVIILALLYMITGVIIFFNGLIFLLAAAGSGVITVMGILIVVIALLYLLVGWGLWTMKAWAKKQGLVPPILGLIAFPAGTILSVILLILWLLFRREIANVL